MTKKSYIILFIVSLLQAVAIAQDQQPSPRKKVAVVLSGGGAKGVAHVKALKVIEKAGIPVDYVVGTSMGSLVGALYSIGYTTEQMDSIISEQDWRYLLTDGEHAQNEPLNKRVKSEQYIISIPFQKRPSDAFKGGVVQGRNLARLFAELTEGYHDSIDFKKLPIPFACVSYDIVKGEEYVFYSGKLAVAMRSSMSIPGVFNPVKWNGKVLIDGGMTDNYPVDIAKKMGADIVIGIDVQDSLATADNLNTMSEVLGQIVSIICANKYEENVKNSDVHIQVNTNGYSAASFNKIAIDTLMQRGETATMAHWNELTQLKKKIGIPITYHPKKREKYVLPSYSHKDIKEIYPGARPSNSISIGTRFDNETLASLLFNSYINLNKSKTDQLDLTLKLGKSVKVRADYLTHPFKIKGNVVFGLEYDYNDINLFSRGRKIVNYAYHHSTVRAGILSNWRKARASFGIRGELFNYNDFLMPPDMDVTLNDNGTGLIAYYLHLLYSDYDKRMFPTKGMRWHLDCDLYTDNFIKYKNNNALSTISASWSPVFMLTRRFAVQPSVYGRIVMSNKNSAPLALLNFIGGEYPGRYYSQQMPFAGVNNVEYAPNKMVIGGIKFRQRMGANQYVMVNTNIGYFWKGLSELDLENTKIGFGVSYAYDTFIGPIGATFSWSNITKEIGFYLGIGYNF